MEAGNASNGDDLSGVPILENNFLMKLPVITKGPNLTANAASAAKSPTSDDETDLKERIAQCVGEIVEFSRLLAKVEQEKRRLEVHTDWLHQLVPIIRKSGFRLRFLKRWQKDFLLAKLKSKGLFDANAYLAMNPDVARVGIDPLAHYLNHGLSEGCCRR